MHVPPIKVIVQLEPDDVSGSTDAWALIADCARGWMTQHGVVVRDAVVLIPFVQLLAAAQRAFAEAAGWSPRIATVHTLAATLGPADPWGDGQLTFDPVIDALLARALLQAQPWGADWARRDLRGFERAASAVATTAQALARSAANVLPAERDAYWTEARQLLSPVSGPGGTERLLARVALEWASLSPKPMTDRLFAMTGVSAWIVVNAGDAPDVFSASLMDQQAHVPRLIIDTSPPADDLFSRVLVKADPPTFGVCESVEHEAQCAAAHVLDHIKAGEVPIALVAQDRLLMRRYLGTAGAR